jgi:hypothetical protein
MQLYHSCSCDIIVPVVYCTTWGLRSPNCFASVFNLQGSTLQGSILPASKVIVQLSIHPGPGLFGYCIWKVLLVNVNCWPYISRRCNISMGYGMATDFTVFAFRTSGRRLLTQLAWNDITCYPVLEIMRMSKRVGLPKIHELLLLDIASSCVPPWRDFLQALKWFSPASKNPRIVLT